MSQTLSAVYPWQSGQKLTAAALDAKFAALDALLANQANQISLLQSQTQTGNLPTCVTVSWGGGDNVAPGPYELLATSPYDQTILTMSASVGTNGGSFQVTVLNNGVPIDGLNQAVVGSAFRQSFTAIANRFVAQGNELVLVVSNVQGLPANAWVSLNLTTNAVPSVQMGVAQASARGDSSALAYTTYALTNGASSTAYATASGSSMTGYQGIGSTSGIANASGDSVAGAFAVSIILNSAFAAASGGSIAQAVGSYSTGPQTLSLDSSPLDSSPLG